MHSAAAGFLEMGRFVGPATASDTPEVDVFRTLLDRSGLLLAGLDLQMCLVEASDEFVGQFGTSRESLIGSSFYELLHPGVHAPMRRQFTRLLEGRRERFVEHLAGVGPRRTVFTGEIAGIAVHSQCRELVGFVVLVNPEQTEPADAVVVDRNRILSEIGARILEGIAGGESTVCLASRLFLSRQGVEYHVGTMLKKLKAPNRAALVSRAYSLGVLTVGSWPPKVSPDFVK
ncbi:helix-turn-helix transcriptional regulator [Streptomyces pacificus]|uniref:PAS domain-containing protein n=1 Tax=Streptomyces pacificus TaxID=2705029 RepID=A0A6A0B2A0_9ACTN|nr:LuxR C-terminal-related transcriptional regulator [Streptomyces pacificus]GFH39430.1 PAS domain-containing protein [Streptomyces pacificus]